MKEIIMPKFGFTQETAEVVAWLVGEGDVVEAGDPLLEVTTDKINMEVEAPVDGILAGVRVKVGDVVPVTEIIAYLLEPGESLPQDALTGPVVVEAPPTGGTATPVAARVAADLGVDLTKVSGSGSGGRITRQDVEGFATGAKNGQTPAEKVRATPAARRIARERSVDLVQVAGSGPRGRIQEADVLAFQPAAADRGLVEAAIEPLPAGDYRVVPMTNMRRSIGQNLQQSWQQAPHIMFQADIDMTAVEALLVKGNHRLSPDEPKITITAAVTRAVAWTLQDHPWLNSRLVESENEIHLMSHINIGIAVALEDGLIVPVVKDANMKGMKRLNEEIRDLAVRARSNQLKPDDISGGTFSISNLGMFGVDRFTAIINPPQAAILAVGRTKSMFVPDDKGQPVVRPICNMTLSADHRVVDGAVAARFMQDLRLALEAPETMLL
ncbi:MAG: dihydrolipoamide acetyltransferase family protein [Ardenticatenaceae bacterium]|nr:dihydrolipoamide acetyltransferase family protein [Ardenticatenaceae bacterium]